MARDESRWLHIGGGEYVRTTSGAPVAPEAPDEVDATAGAVEAAEELGVELSEVKGSGKSGRVTKADVEAVAGE